MMEIAEEFFACKLLPHLSPSELAKIAYRQFGANGLAAEYFRQVIEYLNKEPSISAQEGNKSDKTDLANSAPSSPTIADMNAKFLADKSNFVLKYGGKRDFIKGLESYIGISHFGHFLLTSLLFPLIAKGGDIFLLHFTRFSLVANHFS